MDFITAFQALTTSEKMVKSMNAVLKNAKGHKRAVLRELKENLNLLLLSRKNQLPPDRVIPRLQCKNYIAAADAGFNFKSIKRSSLKEKTTRDVPQFKKYIGWSTERLLENIYLKVKQLQDIIDMQVAAKNLNIDARLENLTRLMILLFQHIKS
ncbi:MAG: hypothetical protein KAT07_12465 [Calditrichia bacterium]|nr:hypothetical protein [Calditrichia bacterium]